MKVRRARVEVYFQGRLQVGGFLVLGLRPMPLFSLFLLGVGSAPAERQIMKTAFLRIIDGEHLHASHQVELDPARPFELLPVVVSGSASA